MAGLDRDDMEPIEWTIVTPAGDPDRAAVATHAWISDAGGLIVGEVDDDGRSWQPVLIIAPGRWWTCEPTPPGAPPWQT